MKRIDHQQAYGIDGACTFSAENYFSCLRRGEAGRHHHISGVYLLQYAQAAGSREDNRPMTKGEQVQRVAKLALGRKKSVDSPDTGRGTSPAKIMSRSGGELLAAARPAQWLPPRFALLWDIGPKLPWGLFYPRLAMSPSFNAIAFRAAKAKPTTQRAMGNADQW